MVTYLTAAPEGVVAKLFPGRFNGSSYRPRFVLLSSAGQLVHFRLLGHIQQRLDRHAVLVLYNELKASMPMVVVAIN